MKTSKCIMLELSEISQEYLREFAVSSGFDLTKTYSGNNQKPEDFMFHVTLMYGINTPKRVLNNGSYKLKKPFFLSPLRFGRIGDNVPALYLKMNIDLINARNEIVMNYGLVDMYDGYKPHISLSYANDKVNLETLEMSYEMFNLLYVTSIKVTDSNFVPEVERFFKHYDR